jgi:hypothetical protein
MRNLIAVLFAISLFTLSCNDKVAPGDIHQKGTIRDYTGLDGCTFIIELDSGEKLEPVNLKDFIDSPKDGQKVKITFKPEPQLASICMVGTIVTIQSLK